MLVTPKEIEAFLRETTGSAISGLSPIGLGEWSTAYSFDSEGQAFVVRFSPYHTDFVKDRIAYAYNSPSVPIPRVVQLGEAFDRYFAISEKLPGIAIDDLEAAEMQCVIPAVLDLLDGLRLADVSGSEGYGFWSEDKRGVHGSWKEALLDITNDTPGKRIHGWKYKLAAEVGLEGFADLQRKLVSLVDNCPEERHLIHSDLLHYNLLVSDNEVSGVLDWGNSLYGDFLYELAWFTFWSAWHPAMAGIGFRQLALAHYADIGLDVPHFDDRLACYELHIALDSIAYCSFTDRWSQVERVMAQAQAVAAPN